MNKLEVSLAICLALTVVGALGPTSARAQHGSFHGQSVHMGGTIVGSSAGARALVPPWPRGPFVHRRVFRPFAPARTGLPLVVYAPPGYSGDGPPGYYEAPVDYDPSAGGMSGAIEYPSGHYELHGDGTTTPYVWVWIPNLPSAPPDVTSRGDSLRRVDKAQRRPSSSRDSPGPKIIDISGTDMSAPATDPTAPKIISIPAAR